MNQLARFPEWLDRSATLLARSGALAARHRRVVFVLALLLFAGGLWLSLDELDARIGDIAAAPLLVNLFVLAPSALLLSAWGLKLTARTIGRSIGLFEAVRATALGTVAELLPIPGGLIARSAALATAGAPALDIAQVLALNGLLWFGLLALMASAALLFADHPAAGLTLAAIGLPVIVSSLAALRRRAQTRLLVIVLAHRALSLAINVLRMATGFAALQALLGVHEAMLLTAANSLGSFSTAIPSGLGVGEALAALAAVAIAEAPALAFTVTALNRVCYLMIAGGSALLATARSTR